MERAEGLARIHDIEREIDPYGQNTIRPESWRPLVVADPSRYGRLRAEIEAVQVAMMDTAESRLCGADVAVFRWSSPANGGKRWRVADTANAVLLTERLGFRGAYAVHAAAADGRERVFVGLRDGNTHGLASLLATLRHVGREAVRADGGIYLVDVVA